MDHRRTDSRAALSVCVALLLSVAGAARAQDAAADEPAADATPAAAEAPSERTRFDLGEALAEGEHALGPSDAARLATERSPRVEVAELAVAAAEAGMRRATAALAPRLDLTARYAHIDGFPDGRIGTPPDPATLDAARALATTVTDPSARTLLMGMVEAQATAGSATIRIPRDQFGFGARLTFLLSDTIFALLPALSGAEGRVRAEELRVEAARHDVELQAVEAYYRYAEARGLHAVARAAAAAARDRLALVEASVAAGVLTPPDALSAEAAVAQADEAVARAGGAVALAGAALGILVGDEGTGTVGVSAALESGETRGESIEAAELRALDERPELRALREAIAAQRDLRTATAATGYPHLGLYVAGDVSNPSPRIIPPREEFTPTYELGVTLTWSPNDLATSIFMGEELDAQIASAEAQLRLLEDAVRLELRQAWEAVGAAREARDAADAALRAAEEAYAARAAQLAAGDAVLTELVAADLRVTEAQLSTLRARVELSLASARLRHALGEPLSE